MSLDRLIEQAAAALAKAPVDHWEVYASEGEALTIGVRDGQVDKFQASSSVAAAFRVLVGGRMGFAYLHGEGAEATQAAVNQAVAAAAAADPIPELSLPGPAGDLPEVASYDPMVLEESEPDRIERARRLAAAALEADPRVKKVQPAQVTSGAGQARLVNSLGLNVSHRATSVGAMVAVMAGENGEQEQGYEGESARFLADLDVEKVGRMAGLRAAGALGGKPVGDGRYDIVLENGVVADFLGILAPSFTGDNIYKGRSLLAGRLGEQVVGQVLTLVDDAHYPKGPGSTPFDGEGTPTGQTVLLDQGRLSNFVYDRLYGALAGKASTGNAARGGVGAPPRPGLQQPDSQTGPGQSG